MAAQSPSLVHGQLSELQNSSVSSRPVCDQVVCVEHSEFWLLASALLCSSGSCHPCQMNKCIKFKFYMSNDGIWKIGTSFFADQTIVYL